jgi:hypothetical protein
MEVLIMQRKTFGPKREGINGEDEESCIIRSFIICILSPILLV